jgi:hypothetical protein
MLGAAWPAAIPEDRFMALLARAPVFRNVDCAGAVMPDLRSLRRSLRNVTLYGEAGPEMVIRCMKLSSSSVDVVCVGTAATAMYCYGSRRR